MFHTLHSNNYNYIGFIMKIFSAIIAVTTAILAEYVIINMISMHFQFMTIILLSVTLGMIALLTQVVKFTVPRSSLQQI
jgi:hypothetical protein